MACMHWLFWLGGMWMWVEELRAELNGKPNETFFATITQPLSPVSLFLNSPPIRSARCYGGRPLLESEVGLSAIVKGKGIFGPPSEISLLMLMILPWICERREKTVGHGKVEKLNSDFSTSREIRILCFLLVESFSQLYGMCRRTPETETLRSGSNWLYHTCY